MLGNTVRLNCDETQWLEISVTDGEASARVGHAEPFGFNVENLGFVSKGLGYQAWGAGSFFALQKTPTGFSFEFQGPDDRCPAICVLSATELETVLRDLFETESRAIVL